MIKEKDRCCKNCNFKSKWNDSCHRFPPTVVGKDYNSAVSLFPTVKNADWCGEWQEKEEEN